MYILCICRELSAVCLIFMLFQHRREKFDDKHLPAFSYYMNLQYSYNCTDNADNKHEFVHSPSIMLLVTYICNCHPYFI